MYIYIYIYKHVYIVEYIYIYIYIYIIISDVSRFSAGSKGAHGSGSAPESERQKQHAVDFRNFIVFFWAETLAH